MNSWSGIEQCSVTCNAHEAITINPNPFVKVFDASVREGVPLLARMHGAQKSGTEHTHGMMHKDMRAHAEADANAPAQTRTCTRSSSAIHVQVHTRGRWNSLPER